MNPGYILIHYIYHDLQADHIFIIIFKYANAFCNVYSYRHNLSLKYLKALSVECMDCVRIQLSHFF